MGRTSSRQLRQTFQLTIGDDISGEVSVPVAVRSGHPARGTGTQPQLGEELALYDLQGRLIFRGSRTSPAELQALRSSLARGVYLYVVQVKGFDDRVIQTKVEKLVILR